MGASPIPPISITITLSQHIDQVGSFLKATTWGVRNGSYGSLGVVKLPLDALAGVSDQATLARIVLTALYGLDYDL